MTSLFAFLFAPGDMWIILIVALLLFGNRLPSVMRSLGKGVTEFKKGIEGIEDDADTAKKSEPEKVDEQPAKS
jgi:sec-independent protein translocase protein TatA